MTCKISRLFVNTLTADDKDSLLNRDNLMSPIQMQFSQKKKALSEFFCEVLKFILNFENFRQKMTLIYDFFSKLRNPKTVAR